MRSWPPRSADSVRRRARSPPSAGRLSCVDELFAFADSLVHLAVARATEMLSGGTVEPRKQRRSGIWMGVRILPVVSSF